uniref:5'-deoxynucleotidase HDDC2 n=1 Tax=Bos mutus grunniens TaxID=30521 RepID=A0A8B9XC87_BOSMU
MASASPVATMSGRGTRNLLQFLRLVGQLKRVPRTGWVYRNVQKPESVSDHMYRMAVMALVTKDEHLNKDRCVRLALVHDMAECIVGDIAPADNVPREEKHRREEEAMKQLTQLLPEDLQKELYELWEENSGKELWGPGMPTMVLWGGRELRGREPVGAALTRWNETYSHSSTGEKRRSKVSTSGCRGRTTLPAVPFQKPQGKDKGPHSLLFLSALTLMSSRLLYRLLSLFFSWL